MVRSRAWLLCLPALALLLVVAFYPLARTWGYSFTDARLGRLDQPAWIGFENYAYLFRDPDWWRAVWNTAAFTVLSVTLETLLGLGVALVINGAGGPARRGQGAVRAAVLVPWAIPAVVSARIWAWMFNDIYGVVNELLRRLSLGSGETAWLADDRLALGVLVLVDAWKTTPFMALLILAGLQSIPKSVFEAAQIDGASPWRRFRYVTLPLLAPALGVAILFRMLDALRIFDLPFVLTSASRATAVVSVYARQQMVDFQDVGYGSAASVVIFVATALIALVYLASAQKSLGLER